MTMRTLKMIFHRMNTAADVVAATVMAGWLVVTLTNLANASL